MTLSDTRIERALDTWQQELGTGGAQAETSGESRGGELVTRSPTCLRVTWDFLLG